MGVASAITVAIDTIFNTLTELVQSGTLEGKTSNGFDFQTASVIATTNSKTIRFIELNNKVLEDGSIEKELLFKTKELDPSLYSTLAASCKTYRFQSIKLYEAATIILVRSS